WRGPRAGTLSCSRSFHNLSHPPPPYEGPPPPELGRCTSLRRLADRDPDEPWRTYWAPAWAPPPRSALPLAPPTPRGGPAPRRVLSQELLLAGGGMGRDHAPRAGGAARPRPLPAAPPPRHLPQQPGGGRGQARRLLPFAAGSAPWPAPPPPPPAHPPRRLQRQSTAELQLLPGPLPPPPTPTPPPRAPPENREPHRGHRPMMSQPRQRGSQSRHSMSLHRKLVMSHSAADDVTAVR
ncbi:protein shisa-7, partial [Pezoporus flaviventris]|uniref:protein shisa-7 n=1 Tax=Pezoporus flaviventris TaxID=889875 RepID=UPI002AB1EC08